jgi:O-antigen/teichoic acid export membrane protein
MVFKLNLMLFKIKKKLINLINFLHRIIFGHEMSLEMKKFIKNLSWSFFGGFISAGIMLILTILAGRKLGPEGFGQYNSLLSFATALTFFFLLGNDSGSVRYLSDEKNKKEKKEILSTSLIIVMAQSVIFGLLAFVFSDAIIRKFSLDSNVLIFGVILALVLATKSLFDGYLRSFHLIKKQSGIRIVDAFLSIFFFFLFYYFFKKTEYYYYVVAISCGAIFFILVSVFILRENFGKFSVKSVRELFNYNKFLIIGAIGGIIMSLEKYFIGKYISIYELGVYSAYYAASFLIISNLGAIFMNVFWPSAIKERKSMNIIVEKLNVLFLKVFPFWFVFATGFVSLVVIFMGEGYAFNWVYVFLISVSSFMSFVFSTFLGLLKIDRIKESVIVSILCYILLIASIVIFKSILYYIISQILLYSIFYIIIKKRLSIDF